MSKKPTPTSSSSSSSVERGLDPVSSMMQAFLNTQSTAPGPLNWLGTAWMDAFGDVGSELAGFVAERIREDVKTQHEMLHAKTPTDLQQAQVKFIQTAIEQYTAETGKIVELNQKFLDKLIVASKSD